MDVSGLYECSVIVAGMKMNELGNIFPNPTDLTTIVGQAYARSLLQSCGAVAMFKCISLHPEHPILITINIRKPILIFRKNQYLILIFRGSKINIFL